MHLEVNEGIEPRLKGDDADDRYESGQKSNNYCTAATRILKKNVIELKLIFVFSD